MSRWFRTLIERCEYVSLNVFQNLLSAKLALHVTAVLATTSKMNRLPRVYIVLLQNEQIAAIIRVGSPL